MMAVAKLSCLIVFIVICTDDFWKADMEQFYKMWSETQVTVGVRRKSNAEFSCLWCVARLSWGCDLAFGGELSALHLIAYSIDL